MLTRGTSKQVWVNLIDQKGRELLLGNMFQDLVRQLNSPYVKYGAPVVITAYITRESSLFTRFWPSSLSLLLRCARFDNCRSQTTAGRVHYCFTSSRVSSFVAVLVQAACKLPHSSKTFSIFRFREGISH
jgi:hypothetical protein